MAANFWLSTHCNYWLLPQKEVDNSNRKDIDLNFLKSDDIKRLRVYYMEIIQTLGKLLKLRQRVIATAMVYFKRFYVRNSFYEFDPHLIAPSALYLASKVEECTLQAKIFATAMKKN